MHQADEIPLFTLIPINHYLTALDQIDEDAMTTNP
jgi:hypothetical protein